MKFIHSFGRITRLQAQPPDSPKIRSLHRFSDSWLHNLLLIAVLLLALVALVKALSLGVAVWQLEPVVVAGHPQPPPRGSASTPQH